MCRRKSELSTFLNSIELHITKLHMTKLVLFLCFMIHSCSSFHYHCQRGYGWAKRWLILMVNVNMYVVGSLWHSENAYWGLKCIVCTDTKIITNFHNWNINCMENIQLRDIMHKKSMLWMHFAKPMWWNKLRRSNGSCPCSCSIVLQ